LTRLLFLTESFHPVLGGGETHIRALGSALVRSGLPGTVVTRRARAEWPAAEEVDGVRVLRVPPSGEGRAGKYRMVPWAVRALLRERERFDVLVVRGTRVLGLPGLLAGRWLGKAVVLQPEINGELTGEVYTWGKAWGGGLRGRLVRAATAVRNLLFRDADGFVAMSGAIRGEFLAAGASEEKVALIPHGVDVERFRPASPEERAGLRARLSLPADARIVVYTGRLLRGKGLDILFEAFRRIAPRDAQARLVIVGSGAGQSLSVEEDLRTAAREPRLEGRVLFAGRVDAVEDYLRAADLFAFPSVFEALGISLVEAAACGLPSVGSRTGGIVDVIEDGVTGLLVPPGDARALEDALEALLSDPGRRGEMGRRARERALRLFDAETSLPRYRTLFHEVARAAAGGRRA
jgi:glycosyltransferase involved in cell wall biosynthesis